MGRFSTMIFFIKNFEFFPTTSAFFDVFSILPTKYDAIGKFSKFFQKYFRIVYFHHQSKFDYENNNILENIVDF